MSIDHPSILDFATDGLLGDFGVYGTSGYFLLLAVPAEDIPDPISSIVLPPDVLASILVVDSKLVLQITDPGVEILIARQPLAEIKFQRTSDTSAYKIPDPTSSFSVL